MNLPQLGVVFNWRNEKNKSGLYSIHLRITINRDSRYYKISVPQKVSLAQWSGKEDAWVKNHDFSFEINNKIREKKNQVNELIKRSYNFNKSLSFDTIFRHLKKKGDTNSFYDYMKEFIASPPEKLEENTIKKYNTCLSHLQQFKKDLSFSDIDNTLVREFYRFMQTTLKLQGGSCKKYMEAFKRVIKCARKDNYLDPSQMEFLFDDVKIKVGQSKRTFLEIQEIKQWKSTTFSKGKEYLERDRDLFLFQIYTGYYYKDLPIFTKDQLFEDEEYGYFIIGARDKNNNQTIIPLFKFPYAAAIIRKYQSATDSNSIFNPAVFIEEPAYNRNLKEVAKIAGIKKNISNKVARHTNAQLWVRYGAERPILSKMMGHTKEETTKNYFSVNLPEIVEGTRRADFKKLGI
ncbi:MAG: site-specific integrase [Chitinophagaceae bacterium]|nr:site-specific integrase [Chitinophagaceae bacterium]